jgi:hypothetical protein
MYILRYVNYIPYYSFLLYGLRYYCLHDILLERWLDII